jgi:AraC-like DNA-binding protein
VRSDRIARAPCVPLRPFVQLVWAVEESVAALGAERREHVLPTGRMHLVIRLGQDPLRIFAGPDDRNGTLAGQALIGGARDTFYTRAISGPQCSVGAMFRPGAAEALFGPSAEEFAHRHTSLEDVAGAAVESLRDQLAGLPLDARLNALEALLLARMPRARAMHPAVAQALSELAGRSDVGHVLTATGYSHRTMITLFRRSVGLAPKQYVRILRFARAVKEVRAGRALADAAIGAGYSDQAHLSREFREFSGTTPSEYRRIAPCNAHHLPV